jgi:hypothetical protein
MFNRTLNSFIDPMSIVRKTIYVFHTKFYTIENVSSKKKFELK